LTLAKLISFPVFFTPSCHCARFEARAGQQLIKDLEASKVEGGKKVTAAQERQALFEIAAFAASEKVMQQNRMRRKGGWLAGWVRDTTEGPKPCYTHVACEMDCGCQ